MHPVWLIVASLFLGQTSTDERRAGRKQQEPTDLPAFLNGKLAEKIPVNSNATIEIVDVRFSEGTLRLLGFTSQPELRDLARSAAEAVKPRLEEMLEKKGGAIKSIDVSEITVLFDGSLRGRLMYVLQQEKALEDVRLLSARIAGQRIELVGVARSSEQKERLASFLKSKLLSANGSRLVAVRAQDVDVSKVLVSSKSTLPARDLNRLLPQNSSSRLVVTNYHPLLNDVTVSGYVGSQSEWNEWQQGISSLPQVRIVDFSNVLVLSRSDQPRLARSAYAEATSLLGRGPGSRLTRAAEELLRTTPTDPDLELHAWYFRAVGNLLRKERELAKADLTVASSFNRIDQSYLTALEGMQGAIRMEFNAILATVRTSRR